LIFYIIFTYEVYNEQSTNDAFDMREGFEKYFGDIINSNLTKIQNV